VLVHGYGLSSKYMLPLAQSLASRFWVFAPDLPGYGRSQQPPVPLGIADLAAALAHWLDAVGLDCPAFIANSMGCQIVTELAVRRPERVGPMVLVGPTVDPRRRAARHQLLGGLRDSAREPRSLLALAARDDAVLGVRALLATARSALADRIEQRLPLIEQATVVLRGQADGFVDQKWAEQAVTLLPHGRLVVVPREPHAVHYTRPDLVARVARELVEEGEQTGSQPIRGLPQRHVSAWEVDEPRVAQNPLPLLGDPLRHEPLALRPRRGATEPEPRRTALARLAQTQNKAPCKGEGAPSPHRVADDRRQPLSHLVKRPEERKSA
jgi:2-hydroxy-6-oxonona-2,4-dienedioate hydrolase